MALRFPLRSGGFRTRAASRDAATDLERLEQLRATLLKAIAEARRERDGLQQRVDQYRSQAAFMLEETAEYSSRPAEEEAEIVEAERQAEIAMERVRGLDEQVGLIAHLLAELESSPVWQRRVATA